MQVKAVFLRRVVFLVVLMALAMVSRPAFADETYSLGWADGINPNGVLAGGEIAGTLNASIESMQEGYVASVPTDSAIPGKTVFVGAMPMDGYIPTRLYYQYQDGNETKQTYIEFTRRDWNGDEVYDGTFTMPAANTVIGGEFEKKTYTVSIDFGSAHAGFVQQYYAGKDGVEVDGSVVKLTVAHEEATPQNVASTLYGLLGSSTNFLDNNEFLMTHNSELLLGKKTRMMYSDEEDYNSSRQNYYSREITEDMTLYALWAPSVGKFTLTLTPCKCGDVLEYKDLSRPKWEPEPYQGEGVEGHVSIFDDTHAMYSGWNINKPENSNTFTLQGDTSYNAHVYIAPDWGYFLPDNFANSMTVVNGTYVNSEGGTTYRKLNVSIPVKHVAPEGTKELAPTCTAGDSRTFTCMGCNEEVTETADALGHDWGDPTYGWSKNNVTCTATHTCTREGCGTEESETVTPTSITTATCTEGGTTTYTATFTKQGFQTQTKDVELAALGHDWGEWAQTKAPTCEDKGSEERSCKREGCSVSETREVAALGHDWGDATYTWADDNSTCTATRTCTRDSSHVESETVTPTFTTTATCTKGGTATYRATFGNKDFQEQTKDVELAALGHDWGEWAQTKAPTCEDKGSEERSCKREGCGAKETRDVDPLGHDWGDATYTWTDDNSACTATRTCKRDSSHVQTETVKTSSTVTKEPTATETGTRTYTATFKNEAFNTQTKTETIPKEEDGVTYSIVEGANATWTKGAATSVTITAKRSVDDDTTFSHFTGILVDEKEVDEDQYEAEPGSVVVTLPASFLNTLSVGEHTFTALFDDGSASTKLNVKSSSQVAQTTNTSVQSPAARSTTTSTTGGTTTSTTSGTTTTPSTADKNDTAAAATLAVLSLPLMLVARRLRRM